MMALGGAALATSFLAVHFLGLQPCMMCKLQRIPFALLVINSYLGMVTSCKVGFFRVLQGYLFLGGILGLVHFFVQMRGLKDPCAVQKGLSSVQEFSQLLLTSRCSDWSWKILGVPVSLMNAGICFGVLGLSVRGSSKLRKAEGN